MTDRSLIGSAEACEILGIDRSTLTRWVDKGRILPVHKNPGQTGSYIFQRTEVERLKDQAKAAS
jgi:excisionase family DNA binding protein